VGDPKKKKVLEDLKGNLHQKIEKGKKISWWGKMHKKRKEVIKYRWTHEIETPDRELEGEDEVRGL